MFGHKDLTLQILSSIRHSHCFVGMDHSSKRNVIRFTASILHCQQHFTHFFRIACLTIHADDAIKKRCIENHVRILYLPHD
ncbi:hypothetical protein HanPSC8_Chr16g0697901 [Helianthus annuus]|nr:hypothetical protein HanPSC8_Chr16g0697901 [Helianthus annuus]